MPFENSLIIRFLTHSQLLLKARQKNYLKNDDLAIEHTSTYIFKILKVEWRSKSTFSLLTFLERYVQWEPTLSQSPFPATCSATYVTFDCFKWLTERTFVFVDQFSHNSVGGNFVLTKMIKKRVFLVKAKISIPLKFLFKLASSK